MILYDLLSNAGGRENNEDSVGMYQNEQEYCFVLADGLGGHGKGEVASRLAVETCVNVFAREGAGEEVLSQSFDQAQQAILKGQKEDYHAQDMKTTLVLLHVGEEGIWWGHIGDSRLYYFKNKNSIFIARKSSLWKGGTFEIMLSYNLRYAH